MKWIMDYRWPAIVLLGAVLLLSTISAGKPSTRYAPAPIAAKGTAAVKLNTSWAVPLLPSGSPAQAASSPGLTGSSAQPAILPAAKQSTRPLTSPSPIPQPCQSGYAPCGGVQCPARLPGGFIDKCGGCGPPRLSSGAESICLLQ